jgi:hypothetical protein
MKPRQKTNGRDADALFATDEVIASLRNTARARRKDAAMKCYGWYLSSITETALKTSADFCYF